jgi:hypothetical protein
MVGETLTINNVLAKVGARYIQAPIFCCITSLPVILNAMKNLFVNRHYRSRLSQSDSSGITRMEDKSDFIALYFSICALQMHISLILVANHSR